jgi:protein-tyrosine-phosphatase
VEEGLARRARLHQALSDVHRLAIVDALSLSDRTPGELQDAVGLPSNLLAFHLDVLEEAGLIFRHTSQGDRRRRYVILNDDVLAGIRTGSPAVGAGDGPVLFVCSRNSARSQLAAALWTARTGREASSAGMEPARRVHRHAVEVARRHGLDLSGARPGGYDNVATRPGLVVSVCDRAREAGLPFDVAMLHWSVPNPSQGGIGDFEQAYSQLRGRVDRLAEAVAA